MSAAMGTPSPNEKVRVKKAKVSQAVRALSQLVAKRTATANPLFDNSAETMTVVFALSTVPEKRKVKPFMIRLPHPMYDEKSEVCFICKDPQKKYKQLLMQDHPIPGLTKVIGIDKLRRNYKTVEQKRALADAFDLFLCDSAVAEMMPTLLGSIFYTKKKKQPVPVKMVHKDPRPNIEEACMSTTLKVPTGPCVGVKFGRCSMDPQQLEENAAAVIASVVKCKYMRDNAVQAVSLQATDAPALPVWRRAPPPGDLVDLKKYRADGMSSAASESGDIVSGLSETECGSSEIRSDAGDTLSTRDSVSEVNSIATDSMSEFDDPDDGESLSDSDDLDEAGDVDGKPAATQGRLPLMTGLGKKRKTQVDTTGAAPVAAAMMPPPSKKARTKQL